MDRVVANMTATHLPFWQPKIEGLFFGFRLFNFLILNFWLCIPQNLINFCWFQDITTVALLLDYRYNESRLVPPHWHDSSSIRRTPSIGRSFPVSAAELYHSNGKNNYNPNYGGVSRPVLESHNKKDNHNRGKERWRRKRKRRKSSVVSVDQKYKLSVC
jgi:hypothetical protein